MTFNEYKDYVKAGASEKYNDVKFAALALVGEVGEVCDVIKKSGIYTDANIDFKTKAKDELGDVLWQYTALINSLGLTLDEIIDFNVDKLNKRHGNKKIDLTGGKR